jgi:protein-S-isoprenylcysteine O-methyltransferase Ste14
MKKNRGNASPAVDEANQAAQHYSQPWITDGGWITGLAGTFTILLLGYAFGSNQAHLRVWEGFNGSLDEQKHYVMLVALGIVAAVMYGVELVRLWRFDRTRFKRLDPMVAKGQYGAFATDCLKRFLLLALLFYCCRLGYMSIVEYGFRLNNRYYQPWFYTLELLWTLFLIGGLPYILLTRAYQHDVAADRKDYASLTEKCLRAILGCLPRLSHIKPSFNDDDGRAARGLAVKFFFAPVMTVFFFEQFSHLQNNFDYFFGNAIPSMVSGTYDQSNFGRDLGNLLHSSIFSIDVGLAWCGYVITSRWVDNQTISAEPTMLGWFVCLISYPPIQIIGGLLLIAPGDYLYTQIPNQTLVGIFGTMMLLSYFLYVLPTIWFGLRFSNLTHRGIIRTGPYSIVRHPAYAAKNFGWWCVGFPAAIWVGFSNSWEEGLLYIAGLIFITTIYWARAMTEERHLSMDPDYQEYCRQVPYRFIPRVL